MSEVTGACRRHRWGPATVAQRDGVWINRDYEMARGRVTVHTRTCRRCPAVEQVQAWAAGRRRAVARVGREPWGYGWALAILGVFLLALAVLVVAW